MQVKCSSKVSILKLSYQKRSEIIAKKFLILQETVDFAITSSEESGAEDKEDSHGPMSDSLLTQIQKLSKEVENIWSEVKNFRMIHFLTDV